MVWNVNLWAVLVYAVVYFSTGVSARTAWTRAASYT